MISFVFSVIVDGLRSVLFDTKDRERKKGKSRNKPFIEALFQIILLDA